MEEAAAENGRRIGVSETEQRGRRPSIAAVAERAGVSIATVSRVVNKVSNKASSGTIERVRQAIAELGYRPVSVGRALRRRESRLVGVIAANLENPAMAAIAASIEIALREAGYVMVLCDSHDRPELQDEYLLEMRAQLASAIVLLGAVSSDQLFAFRAAGEPILFVNRRDPLGQEAPFVGIDNAAAGTEVADFLIDRRILSVAVIHGPIASSATRQRVEAFQRRYHDRQSNGLIKMMSPEGLNHLQIGYDAMSQILASNETLPQGVFCLSDLIAYGAFRRLREANVPVPQSCIVMGFDDNPLNDWVAPWLSSVRVPYEQFGPTIVNALKQIWGGDGAGSIILPHQLVERGLTD